MRFELTQEQIDKAKKGYELDNMSMQVRKTNGGHWKQRQGMAA